MAANKITSIKVYPQIFAYRKDWLDAVLAGDPPTGAPGYYFGLINDSGTFYIKNWLLNSLNMETNAIPYTLLTDIDTVSANTININLTARMITEWLNGHQFSNSDSEKIKSLFMDELITSAYTYDNYESTMWRVITPVNKGEEYVIPFIDSAMFGELTCPLRIRVVYVAEYYNASEELITIPFPQTANESYPIILNANNPYDFMETKEYAQTGIEVWNKDGVKISPTVDTFEIDGIPVYILAKWNAVGGSSPTSMSEWETILREDVIGTELMPEVSSLEIHANIIAACGGIANIGAWKLVDNLDSPVTGVNAELSPLNSYRKYQVYKISEMHVLWDSVPSFYINMYFREQLTNYIEANGYTTKTIDGSGIALPASNIVGKSIRLSFDDTFSNSRSEPGIKNTIYVPSGGGALTSVTRTDYYTNIRYKDSSNTWVRITDKTISDTVVPASIAAGEYYSDTIISTFDLASILAVLESIIPESSIYGFNITMTSIYSGTYAGNSITFAPATRILYLKMLSNVSLTSPQISIENNLWTRTRLTFECIVGSSYYCASNFYAPMKIVQNGITLRIGLVHVTPSTPEIPFESGVHTGYYSNGSHKKKTVFEEIINNRPLSLNSGSAILDVSIEDTEGNTILLSKDIGTISVEQLYVMSSPPSEVEIDDESESQISKQ